jgi:zinc protease
LKSELEKSLSDGVASSLPEIKPKPIDGYEFNLIDKDCNATAISFGFPIDVVRGDEDFFALWLFKSWFGEHRNSSSHLYQVIREQRGLNYGDYAYIEAFLNGGGLRFPQPNNPRRKQIFEVWIRPVPHEARLFALRAALRELKKVVDNGLTQEQFEITKKFLLNYCLFYAQTTMDRLGYQVDSRFYGINDNGNYIDYFRKKIQSLTLEQVNKAIKKHIQYNNIKFAIVTKDAEKLKEDLVNNTPSPITYPTPKPQEILNEDKEISVFPIKVSPEKIKIVHIEEMFVR